MCTVCVLGFTTILKNPFFFFGEGEREEKKLFSTCTCVYYDLHLAHLAHLCVRRLSHTLWQTVSVTLELVFDLN